MKVAIHPQYSVNFFCVYLMMCDRFYILTDHDLALECIWDSVIYRDERKRHISSFKYDQPILKTVPERALVPILLSVNFVMVRPILWPQYYYLCGTCNNSSYIKLIQLIKRKQKLNKIRKNYGHLYSVSFHYTHIHT